jgi:hypothetical protein
VLSLRSHLKGLSLKDYQRLEGLHSLDFVLLFVPIEAAFAAALQADPGLFQEAFDQHIVIVSPTTLLATLRVIDSLWRQERQSQNAREIAERAGALYDKFVAFIQDLDEVGTRLQQLDKAYAGARNKLCDGRGNIVSRVENLKLLGARALDKRLLEKYGRPTAEALVESALWECSLFEEHGFRDIKISVKHNDPVVMIRAYRQLAEQCDYPLHLGVTEAGPSFQGTVKSSVAFGALLAEGIGDTIRVSLSAPPVEEIKVGNAILESLGLKERGLEIISCPSCGRAQVDVYTLAEQVTAALEGFPAALRVAVMGCVVNGPGEAREADLGVASGNGKGQIFVKGEVIKTVPESMIVETLVEEALKIAAEMGISLDDDPAAAPLVTVH